MGEGEQVSDLDTKIEELIYQHRKGRGADQKYMVFVRSICQALQNQEDLKESVLTGDLTRIKDLLPVSKVEK